MIDIQKIFKDCNFKDLNEDNFQNQVTSRVNLQLFDWAYGCTKGVIKPYKEKYVFKIPFQSEYNEDEGDYIDFVNANDTTDSYWDYCFTEVLVHKEAKDAGVGYMFPRTRLLGYVNDYPVYIQQKVTTYNGRYHGVFHNSRNDIEYVRNECDYNCFGYDNIDWTTDIYLFYGKKKFNKIMRFLADIEDLHSDNIGYINDRPVVFDYSGFSY